MTKPSSEEQLRMYYGNLDMDHPRLRSELLALLPAKEQPNEMASALVHISSRKSAWLTLPRLAIAALLFVAIGLSALHRSGPAQTAYGMEHLAERLLTVRSLHVEGWMYRSITTEQGEEKIEKFPIEQYFSRPHYLAYSHYMFSSPGGGKPTQISRTSTASDGKQTIVVMHGKKTAFIAAMPQDPFRVELLVESQIQSSLVSQFLQAPFGEYRKLRSERVDNVLCDLYVFEIQPAQHVVGKYYLWLNPQTGIPTKAEICEVDEEGKEQLAMSQRFRVNVEPPAELFSFRAPEGYQVIDTQKLSEEDCENLSDKKTGTGNTVTVTKSDPAIGSKLSYYGAGGSDTAWLATWYSLRIDDRAALVCWHQYDTDEDDQKHWFAQQPKFELYQGNGSRACSEQTLATNQVGDDQWRWSLIRPDDGEPLGEELLRFSISDKRTENSEVLKPLRFPEKRLREIILEAQRRSLPDGTSERLFTLEELRAHL